VWLRLVRQGGTISAFVKAQQTDEWSPVGTQELVLSDPVYVGMAVTSHHDGVAATALFEFLKIAPLSVPPGLPIGWEQAEVGAPAAGGSASYDGSGFAVRGSGADIWGTADSFHYAYTRLPGDGSIQLRVSDIAGPHEWSKAGLMIRASLSPSAPHHFLLRSEGHGLAYQRRIRAGESSLHTDLGAIDASVWYRIERQAGTVRIFYSTDAGTPSTWQPIAESFFPTGEVLVGLAVTSHSDGELATGTFDNVVVTFGGAPEPTWASTVVGAVALPGASNFDGATWTLQTSGADVWGTADAFRYTYRPLAGNGSIVARVASLAGPHPWSKAGVMIRQNTTASAAHAFLFVSPDNGVAFQRRTAAGGLTTHTSGGGGTAPQWLRLTRSGSIVTASVSADGITWIDVGSDTLGTGSVPMLIGLAVTSHDNSVLATATFDNVGVIP
jgi:regulation of enolase protein 1 (concanavalin A-like superfamily)